MNRSPFLDLGIAVYVDLDGVKADYEAGIRRLGFSPDPALARELNRSGTDNPLKREMYEAIKGTDFYETLPILPGAFDLWRDVKKLDSAPSFLTAAPKFGATEADFHLNEFWLGAAYRKRRWVEHVLLPALVNAGIERDFPREALRYCETGSGYVSRVLLPDWRFTCTISQHKRHYTHRRGLSVSVLVDDREQNIADWIEAGGIGILHDPENVQATIAQLQRLHAKLAA